MRTDKDHCDHAAIDAFLAVNSNDPREPELVGHIEHCAECRQYMEHAAAEPQTWRDASVYLRPTEFDQASSVECSAASAEIGKPDLPGLISCVVAGLTPSEHPHRLGRIGAYEISGVIGVGGMGVVLKAIDTALDRVVALKVMAPHLATSGTARKRFAREAKAAAAVLHPNVIPIHSVSSDNETPYLVMGYIRGGSLQKRLEREGPLPVVEILRIGSQVAAGLSAAHEQGLVHRDIKPENILLEDGVERVTLTDFGLARAVDDSSLTQQGTIAGTPQFMSPEQARGEAVDHSSDLFSLGSVLYTLCTGRVPFRADSSHSVLRKIIDETPIPIRELNPEIPPWLVAIINRLMAKEKKERYGSAKELHTLLDACLSHVQQPTLIELPDSLRSAGPDQKRTSSFITLGVLAMSLTMTALLWITGGISMLVQDGTSPHATIDQDPAGLAKQVEGANKEENRPQELTWPKLLGMDIPQEDLDRLPKEPLVLIGGLNASRGSWLFSGQSNNNGELTKFEGTLHIEGGFKTHFEEVGRPGPGWTMKVEWPRENPEHTWKIFLLPIMEGYSVKWRGVSVYSQGDQEANLQDGKIYDGQWDLANRTLTLNPWAMGGPGTKNAVESVEHESVDVPTKVAVNSNGQLEFTGFKPLPSFSLAGVTVARIGEPYVEPNLNRVSLPNGYRVFFASREQVLLVDDSRNTVAGARLEKIGCHGKFIFGLITQREGSSEPEDTLGYFWLDSETGKIAKGLDAEPFGRALRAIGVVKPQMFSPEEVGPKF